MDKLTKSPSSNMVVIEMPRKTRDAPNYDLDREDHTALHNAIEYAESSGDFAKVDFLLRGGATLESEDEKIRTLLHLACREEKFVIAKLILDINKEANIIYKDGDNEYDLVNYSNKIRGFTPLDYACLTFNVEIIKLLLENGANPNIQSKDGGLTCMHHLVTNRSKEKIMKVLKLLLAYGAKVDIIGKSPPFTAYILACLRNHSEIIELFLKQGAKPDEIVKWDNSLQGTVLHYLCCFRNVDMIYPNEFAVLYKKYGGDIDCRTILEHEILGYTALHLACKNKPSEINYRVTLMIKTLIELGANINTKAGEKYTTPLHLAVQNKNNEIIHILLLGGANPFILDNDEKKPLDYTIDPIDRKILEKAEKIWKDLGLEDVNKYMIKIKKLLSEIQRLLLEPQKALENIDIETKDQKSLDS